MDNKKQKPTDNEIIAEWRSMLKIFEGIMQLNQDTDAQLQYVELIIMASASKLLTPRQKEGISDRCKYRIYLIENPKQRLFSNLENKNLELSKAQSNGVAK